MPDPDVVPCDAAAEEKKAAMDDYMAMRERDAEREKEMVTGMSRNNSTTQVKQSDLSFSRRSEFQPTIQQDLVPAEHDSPPSTPQRDNGRTLSSKSLSKNHSHSSMPKPIPEDSGDEEGEPHPDQTVMGSLRTLRSIIGSTKNLKKEFVNMDLNGDQCECYSQLRFWWVCSRV